MVKYKYPCYIIQGAQWGSEGKGQVAAIYARDWDCLAAVRTGSINAGHTVSFKGRSYKMQLLPTAWVNNRRDTFLVLGPGCYIHRETLARECKWVSEALGWDIRERLIIDRHCPVHTEEAEIKGGLSGRHQAMGATGKGSSDAVIEHMHARANLDHARRTMFSTEPTAMGIDFKDCLDDAPQFLTDCLAHRGPVLLEGTQGALLDFITGPYPYVTNRATSTAAWLAYAGLPPTVPLRVVLVARTYPIRVAGNSGPMPGETTWPKLYRKIRTQSSNNPLVPRISEMTLTAYENSLRKFIDLGEGPRYDIDLWSEEDRYLHRHLLSDAPTHALQALSEQDQEQLLSFFEFTTVTRKLRRVAHLCWPLLEKAVQLNGGDALWVTFLNYQFPGLWACTDAKEIVRTAGPYLHHFESLLGVPVVGVTTEREAQHHVTITNL